MATAANQSSPGMFDIRGVYRRVLQQLKVPNIDEILPNPLGAKESNPALENVGMTMGRPAAAYPDQDHISHIKIHLEYAANPAYGGNPVIGPVFAPHALEHIKQHLTLHYLQSMRGYVAQASGGRDVLELHQEKPLDLEAQQALALASQMVNQDSQQTMQEFVQQIQQLAQKVQQGKQAQAQAAAESDPTAQVLLKTQMAETQRKQQESQARMQLEAKKQEQDYDLKIAELERLVLDLKSRYETQSQIDSNKTATQIAIADINNASKERIAAINAQMQLTTDQQAMAHEQNMTALEASHQAQADIRQHGITVEQQAFQSQADYAKAQLDAQQQAQQTGLEQMGAMQQADQQHQQTLVQGEQQNQNALNQMAAQPQPTTPPTGAV
jgi:hypothetical protein